MSIPLAFHPALSNGHALPMTDFILRSSPASPFGRKVKLSAVALGLTDRLTVERADTTDPADSVRAQNPLGKIPVLVGADGLVLYDSRVIVEYLDHLAGGGRLIPSEPALRFTVLRQQALADGLMDAAILRRYEIAMRKPEERSAGWDAHQAGKVERALDALEADPAATVAGTIAEIATACALAYLDFRFDGVWRTGRPALAAWFDAVTGRLAGWEKTRPE